MTIERTILWIIVIVAGLLLIALCSKNYIEGFEDDPETLLKQEVNNYITSANDTLCPCYSQVLDQMITDNLSDSQKSLPASEQDPDERHKAKAKAIYELAITTIPTLPPVQKPSFMIPPIKPNEVSSLQFSLQRTAFLFPCPPPTDPIQLPNNIGDYIVRSSIAFIPKLEKIKRNIESALSCKNKNKKEGFQTSGDIQIHNYINIQHTTNEAFEDVANDDTLKQQRIQVLQIKADSLKKALSSEIFMRLQQLYKQVMEEKNKAESGQITSNCSA